jgi:hypothetical protein
LVVSHYLQYSIYVFKFFSIKIQLLLPLVLKFFDPSNALHINSIFHYALGFVYSGMGPDFRVLVRNARKNAQKYFLTYREVQPVSQIVKESALLMQEYTQSGKCMYVYMYIYIYIYVYVYKYLYLYTYVYYIYI